MHKIFQNKSKEDLENNIHKRILGDMGLKVNR